MDGDLVLDSGTAVDSSSGGVGNGQATGDGQVSQSFDVGAAVADIGADLGFKTAEVKAPVAEKVAAPVVEVAKPASEPAPADPALTKPTGGIETAPKTWKPEEAALWAQIPDAAKAAIARREEDMFKGLESYKGAAQFGNSMNQVIAPYQEILRAQNVNPVQLITNMMSTQYQLATGSQEQRAQILFNVAKDYGIDLAAAVAGMPAARSDAYQDPEVQSLRAELQQLKSGQASLQQARQQELVSQKRSEVDTFAADPANVHFDDLADDIVVLINANKGMTLAKAYESAVWTNPVTRAKEIARQDAEKQSKAGEEARAKAAQVAASTATNVRVQPKAGAATLPLGTMDDTMEATLRDIKKRN